MDRERIKTERIADQVYSRLRRMIVLHELLPGARLSVPALAERFGVSRSPVREAVLKSVRDGLAVERPRQGAFVVTFEPDDLRALFELREVLEGLSARLAATWYGPEEMAEMTRLLALQSERLDSDDIEGFVEADIGFHRAVLAASGNPALQEMLGQLYNRLWAALSMRAAPVGPDRSIADHKAVLDAVTSRDPDAAEVAARTHIERAIRRVLEARRSCGPPAPAGV